jgi:hypothetical protein
MRATTSSNSPFKNGTTMRTGAVLKAGVAAGCAGAKWDIAVSASAHNDRDRILKPGRK